MPTMRERAVDALIAGGLTSQLVIATVDQLVVARSTFDLHVVHIRTKLRVSGRTRVAVWAATNSGNERHGAR
jgi:DNA-binding NarL/FixJ family response regulator